MLGNLCQMLYLINEGFFQMLMSVLQENTVAVLMLIVTIPMDRTAVHVNLDTTEMEKSAARVMFFRSNFMIACSTTTTTKKKACTICLFTMCYQRH